MATNNAINMPNVANQLPIGNGSSGFTTIGYSSTTARGNNLMSRDADGNTAVNSIAIGTTSTPSSGGTINLYIGSAQEQILTGSMAETYTLPVATSLVNGWTYLFNNNSTGNMVIQYQDTTSFITVTPGAYAEVFLTDDTTANGVWDYHWSIESASTSNTAGFTTPGKSKCSTFQMTTGATNGYILESDASGNGTWVVNAGANAITTVDGDAGQGSVTPTAGVISLTANTTAGETVLFSGSSSTLSLVVTDSNHNTIIGSGAGNTGQTAAFATALGYQAMNSVTTAADCTCVGATAGAAMTSNGGNTLIGSAAGAAMTGSNNTALGVAALSDISGSSAQYNIAVGYQAGELYSTNESSNILIGNQGVTGESNALHIGAATGSSTGQLSTAYISGINGNTVSSAALVTIDTSTDQLGTMAIPASFTSINVQEFTYTGSPQTYTPTAGMVYCTIELVGGGGGGGASSDTSAGQSSSGSGGAGGGYARKTVTAAVIGGSQTVTIGAGGTAGTANTDNAGTGGTTSVGAIVSATGGDGGVLSPSATSVAIQGNVAGVGSSGDVNVYGQGSSGGFGTGGIAQIGGSGGSSYFGGGARSQDGSDVGLNASGYGGGSSGATSGNGTTGNNGGTGGPGYCVITEYIS